MPLRRPAEMRCRVGSSPLSLRRTERHRLFCKKGAMAAMTEKLTYYDKWLGKYMPHKGTAIGDIYTKLGRLEELEAAGRLVELPCKVGDWVYKVHYKEIRRHHVCQVHIGQTPAQTFFSCYGEYFGIEEFGKTVFLTREEAEAALKGGGQDE